MGLTPDLDILASHKAADYIENLLSYMIKHQPRSMQRIIGPSEIGTDCIHCLCCKLAQVPKRDEGTFWASFIGSSCHKHVESLLRAFQHANKLDRFMIESKIHVGNIGDQQIWGSCDLFDKQTKMVVDWKFVSLNRIKQFRQGNIPKQYQIQANLYAKGLNDAGIECETVSVCFLPRTEHTWGEKIWWIRPYNKSLALEGLERANKYWEQIRNIRATQGEEGLLEFLDSLPRVADCFDCVKYPQFITPEPLFEYENNLNISRMNDH